MPENRTVLQMNNGYIEHVNRRRRFVRATHIRRFKWLLAIFGTLILLTGVQLWQTKQQLKAVNQSLVTTKVSYQQAKKEQAALQQETKLLKQPKYLEQVVRQKYDYAKKGEVVYRFAN